MKVGVIDFNDSFTYNLVHYLEEAGAEVEVFLDGQIDLDYLFHVDKIVLSPGPGLPSEKIALLPVIDRFHAIKPILGVCLGMQGIAHYFGGDLFNLSRACHGFSSEIEVSYDSPLYADLPKRFSVARYHSWAVQFSNLNDLVVDARTADGIIMSFFHKKYPIYGVQFHPESILTAHGKKIINNFLQL